jgi:hypothetical protein
MNKYTIRRWITPEMVDWDRGYSQSRALAFTPLSCFLVIS